MVEEALCGVMKVAEPREALLRHRVGREETFVCEVTPVVGRGQLWQWPFSGASPHPERAWLLYSRFTSRNTF